MLALPDAHLISVWSLVTCLVCAAWCDARSFQIPNRWPLAIAALYPAHVLSSPALPDYTGAILPTVIVFLVGIGLYAARIMGGGDVKLLAATTLWAGADLVVPFIVVTMAAGGVLALLIVLWDRFARLVPTLVTPRTASGVGGGKLHLPYGVAICAGGLFLAAQLYVP